MSKYYSSSIAFGANQTKTEQVVVSTTKIGNVTTDAVSGALTVDEVPTLNSLNPVSSDGVARAVIQAGAELPTRSSEDTGTVLTVINSDGDLDWVEPPTGIPDMEGKDGKILGAVDDNGTMKAQWIDKPESVTVDQTYSSSSTNPQSGTAVAGAIAGINQVPAVGSGNDGMVLKATYSGGEGSYSWDHDDNTTYYAGNGIDIDGWNDISVNHDTTLKDVAVYQPNYVGILQNRSNGKYATTPSNVAAALDDSGTVDHIKLHIPGNTFSYYGSASEGVTIGFGSDQWFNQITHPKAAAVTLSVTFNSNTGYTWIDEQDVIIPAPVSGQNWVVNTNSLTNFAFFKLQGGLASTGAMFTTSSNNISLDPVVFGIPDNSVPKKLGVNLSGLTTAGITDIQQVNALPASPIATVLYLIPET